MTYGVYASYADARFLLWQWSGQHPPGSTVPLPADYNPMATLVVYSGTLTSFLFFVVHY